MFLSEKHTFMHCVLCCFATTNDGQHCLEVASWGENEEPDLVWVDNITRSFSDDDVRSPPPSFLEVHPDMKEEVAHY